MFASAANIICGQSSKLIRDLLRLVPCRRSRLVEIAQRDGIPKDVAMHLIDSLVAEDYLEHSEYELLEIGPQGARLRNAKFLPPMSRHKALVAVEKFLKRVEVVNRRNELAFSVRKVLAFGSYIGTAPHLSDIDLAIDLARTDPAATWDQRRRQRAVDSGRNFSTHLDFLDYGRKEVTVILRGRQPYFSIHQVEDLKAIGAANITLYSSQ